MQGVWVPIGKPDRHRDMLYARRPFLMLRECSDTGQFAGFWLVLRPHRAKWLLALTFVRCGRHGMALYHRSPAPAQQPLRRWAPVMPSLGFLVIHLGLRDARTNGLRGVQRGLPPHEAAFVGVPQVGWLAADQEMGRFRGIGEALIF